MHKKILNLALASLCTFSAIHPCLSEAQTPDRYKHPFYVGVTGGYGSTTWGHLVPKDPNAAMSLSTPIYVKEGGTVLGVFGGYEFMPEFALEASYMHYPNARLYFDPISLFTFNYDGRTELTSRTETVALMGKVMLFIPHTDIRGYSSFGVATIHRKDAIQNIWRVDPTFGAGLNYTFSEHWMTELGINYTAGYGQAEIDPTTSFVPFLYSVFLRLAYRI